MKQMIKASLMVVIFLLGATFTYAKPAPVPYFKLAISNDNPILIPVYRPFNEVELTADEISGLQRMREEEKFARDMYQKFHLKYQMPVFNNLALAENKHAEKVHAMLEKYGIPDPAAGKAIGEFDCEALKTIYDDFVLVGNRSITDALRMSALFEDMDIFDLQKQMQKASQGDIKKMYQEMMDCSKNHLRNLVELLHKYHDSYTPMYLDQKTYQQIMETKGVPICE